MEPQTFVYGRDAGMARLLLDTAAALGYPAHVVRATESGFYVPDPVWSVIEATVSAPEPEAAF